MTDDLRFRRRPGGKAHPMIRRLIQQLSGTTTGRRPARGGYRGRRSRPASGGTGARIGSAVERYIRTRR